MIIQCQDRDYIYANFNLVIKQIKCGVIFIVSPHDYYVKSYRAMTRVMCYEIELGHYGSPFWSNKVHIMYTGGGLYQIPNAFHPNFTYTL
jgi:hypothetical protein